MPRLADHDLLANQIGGEAGGRTLMPWGIGFIGADGTGKTTVNSHLQRQYGSKINSVSGVARSVIAKGLPLGKNATSESYIALMEAQIKAILELEEEARPFLSDRTILDQFVYSRVNLGLLNGLSSASIIALHEQVWRMERTYFRHYFYLPIEFPMVADGVRESDSDYQYAIDADFRTIIQVASLPVTALSGSIESRVAKARATIDRIFFR